jgi:alkylation response protein AidB-like acyl-CoA dehydrogenase
MMSRHVSSASTREAFQDLARGQRGLTWQLAVDNGLLRIHLPEKFGGDGGGVPELATVLDETGYGLFPGPLLPTVLTSLVIDRCGREDARARLLPGLAAGVVGACAVGVGSLVAAQVDGQWSVSGVSAPVLCALGAEVLVIGAADGDRGLWFVLDGDLLKSVKLHALESADPTRDLAEVVLDNLIVPAESVLDATTDDVSSIAAVLFAAEAVGVARWCQESGLAYAKIREQFGKTIGSFQAVKHNCARIHVVTELITGIAWDAAVAAEQDPGQLYLAAAAAATYALPRAVDVALETLLLLGGIGYTWEHDLHLYWRRAISLQALVGPHEAWAIRLAHLAQDTDRNHNVQLASEPAGLRAEVAGLLADALAIQDLQERRTFLAERGLAAPHYPEPYGLGADAISQAVIQQEYARVGLLPPSTSIGEWALPTILAHGTDEQRERFCLPTLRGEIIWCQLFSEPGAGSDLASLRTKAVPAPGGWILNGQKVWTSTAQQADWGMCLARTEPDARKHRGISYFLVDMKTPGLTVRPLREANGEYLFNEVFFENVFVPDECLVGGRGDGWLLARTTLGNERVNIANGGGARRNLPTSYFEALDLTPTGGMLIEAGELVAEVLAFEGLSQRALLRRFEGIKPGAEASVLKIASAWSHARTQRAVLNWAGPRAAAHGRGHDAAHRYLSVPQQLIGGGTLEIQYNVVGEHVLGLPRS